MIEETARHYFDDDNNTVCGECKDWEVHEVYVYSCSEELCPDCAREHKEIWKHNNEYEPPQQATADAK